MTLSSGTWLATRLAVVAGVVLMLSTAHLPARAAGDSLAPGSGAATHTRVGLTTDPACTRVDDSPGGLTATVSGATVTLQWIAPYGCTPASYVVLAGSGPNLSNLADFPTGNSATTFTVHGVPAGIYHVRVQALAGAVRTSASNEVAIAVGIACELPAAPLALSATATPSSASLEWDAAAGSPTSYVIEAGSAPELTNLVTLATAGPATTFSTAAPAGTYYVRVRARNACGTGPASNEVIVAVAAPTPIPPVLTLDMPVTLSGTQVVVFSAATVTVKGRIELHDRSVLIIRDSTFNHVAEYAGQFDLWAYDDSKVIIERSTIDSSVYMSWHFFDRSALQMTHVINRSSLWTGFQQHASGTYAHVTRAYGTGAEGTTLQVHHAAESFIELVFPPGATVDEALPPMAGVSAYHFPGSNEHGVRHSLTMSNVQAAVWGITYNPESDITMRNTHGLVVTFNIPRSYSGLTARFDGLRATLYHDQVWDTGASRLHLIETSTLPWSPIVSGNNTLIITDSELADITNVYDTATVYIADSTLSQARAQGGVHYTLERSYVTGDLVAWDDSVITMTGGGVGGRAVRDPRAQILVNGVLTKAPGFDLGHISRITTSAAEVLSGTASLKASYFGPDRYQSIVRTNRTLLPLGRGRTYRASFRYRILTPPSQGFDLTFVSPTAFSQGIYLPNLVINGAAGDAGTATLTVTLAAYDDYDVSLSIVGTGAILVDDFQIVDVATGAVVTETAETPLAAR
jgi:hypothetical protein